MWMKSFHFLFKLTISITKGGFKNIYILKIELEWLIQLIGLSICRTAFTSNWMQSESQTSEPFESDNS